MTQPARTQEPSMEEILASIRRIIADDDAAKTQPSEADQAAAANAGSGAAAMAGAAPASPRLVEKPTAIAPEHPSDGVAGTPRESGGDGEENAASDIFELTESMEMPSAKVVGFRTVDADSDVMFDTEPADHEPPRSPPPKAAASEVEVGEAAAEEYNDDALMSSSTTAAVDSAFNALAHTVLVQNARTLDDVVREMLRPMLRTWLDDNLPSMVERMVRAEIERVSRGRG